MNRGDYYNRYPNQTPPNMSLPQTSGYPSVGKPYGSNAPPIGTPNYKSKTYFSALATVICLVTSILAIALPYWVVVEDDTAALKRDNAYIGLWNNCTNEEVLCAAFEAQDVPDWMWSCRIISIIGSVSALVLIMYYLSLYFREIEDDEQNTHLYWIFLLSPLTTALQLVVVAVFGGKFDDIKTLLEVNSQISVNLHVCFYLCIVAAVAAMVVCLLAYLDYAERSGENALRRFIGAGENFTGILYWALALAVIQIALSLIAIALPMYVMINIDKDKDESRMHYGQWLLCLKEIDICKKIEDIPDWLWGSRMTSLFGLVIGALYAILLFFLHRASELEEYYIAQRLYYSLPTAFFAAALNLSGAIIYATKYDDYEKMVPKGFDDAQSSTRRLDVSFYLAIVSGVAGVCALIVTFIEYRRCINYGLYEDEGPKTYPSQTMNSGGFVNGGYDDYRKRPPSYSSSESEYPRRGYPMRDNHNYPSDPYRGNPGWRR